MTTRPTVSSTSPSLGPGLIPIPKCPSLAINSIGVGNGVELFPLKSSLGEEVMEGSVATNMDTQYYVYF